MQLQVNNKKRPLIVRIHKSYRLLSYYFQNMGNKLTQEEQTLSNSLQQQYFFQSNQFLVHKATQKPCTLHRISTFSKQQSAGVERNISHYRQSKCNSISKLKEHFQLDNSGYCSDQSKFYLVFEGHNSPNIKEQYFSRRYAGQKFSNQQIESILSCMLCGLRHYNEVFNRKESRISLESACIDRANNNSLWLKDPWLTQKQNDNSQIPINFLASYPSPQKIQASNQANFDFNQFKSDLFSIGIFGLQFLNMNFRDDLYAHKKYVDRQRVNQSLNSIQSSRLRGGIGLLLSQDPQQRVKIFRYWDIMCYKIYRINSSKVNNLQISNVSQFQRVHSKPYQNFYLLQPTYVPNAGYKHQYSQQLIPGYNSLSISNQSVNAKPQTASIYQISSFSANQQQPHFYQTSVNQLNRQVLNHNSSSKSAFNSSPPKQSSLAQQFSKSLLMKKNSMSQAEKMTENSFKKKKAKVNVVFQSQMLNQSTNEVQASKSLPKQQTNQNYQQIPQLTINAQLGNASNYLQSQQRPSSHKSIQTPKFNYQSPSFNNLVSSTSSFGQGQNSFSGATLVGSFNLNSIQNSKSSFGLQPQSGLQTQLLQSGQQRQQLNQAFNFTSSSPSSTGNSPMLTKSIINPIDPALSNLQYSMYPKISNQQTTRVFSSANPSARQTKFISQSQRNSSSPSKSLPQYTNTQQKNKQESVNNIVEFVEQKNQISYEKPQDTIKSDKNIQIIANIHSSPEQNNSEDAPTSPSTTQVTPPPAIRNPNKYNSTIVQVNQETPHQSSESENQNVGDIQYIVEEYQTGSKYQGFKKNGLRHGRGKFYYQDGGYYDGQWKKNQMHGWGKLFYEGGQLAYEGNWAHDQFHGYGKVYNDNPVVLEGGFDYTNFDLLDDYWLFYEGMLANDTKEGRGRIQLTNKQIFEGDFHADRIQGFGKFLRRDGTIVEGIWRDSRLIKVLNSSDIYK